MPVRAFIFDAYGTLFDVHAAISRHRAAVGPDADRISELWRAKQLEYTWTLSAMGRYEDFERLTERALDFALARFPGVDATIKPALLNAYQELDAYADARATLEALKAAGFVTGIFSNGSPAMLNAAIAAAKIGPQLDHVISSHELRVYKPRHEVYALVTTALKVAASEVAFVSSNRWDVAGAANFGFKPVWVNRAKMPDEYPGLSPVAVVSELAALPGLTL
jgi:2-haloacid dehalogenase